jgi:hypothetical protein
VIHSASLLPPTAEVALPFWKQYKRAYMATWLGTVFGPYIPTLTPCDFYLWAV